MWRNLRNVNVGSAMQALGNVVAPPVNDEDDDSYYEEEEIEEADDTNLQESEYPYEDDDQVEEEDSSPMPKGFGFVGMIARALDRSHEEDEYESYEEEEEDAGEEIVELFPDDNPPSTVTQPALLPPGQNETKSTPPPSTRQGESESDGWDDIHTTWATIQEHKVDTQTNGAKLSPRPSMHREAGSLSPMSPSGRKKLHASPGNRQAQESTRSAVRKLKDSLPDLNGSGTAEKESADKEETLRPKLTPDTADRTNRPIAVPEPAKPAPRGTTSAKSSSTASRSTVSEERPPQPRQGSRTLDQEGSSQIRTSSKVSLSDARFLADPPRSDELETADRWASTSMRNIGGRPSSKDNNTQNSRHSLDSYFDDSSLSSVSANGRGVPPGPQKTKASSKKAFDPNMHASTSAPVLGGTTKTDKTQKVRKGAEDRFCMDTTGPDSRVPPLEPQRQVSSQMWSKDAAKAVGTGPKKPPGPLPEGTGPQAPPRNPRRRQSGKVYQMPEEEVEPAVAGSRPPLVSGNSKDADITPRRPMQRMNTFPEAHDEEEDKTLTSHESHCKESQQNHEIFELERKCAELEIKLELSDKRSKQLEEKWKQEAKAREDQMISFQEKEARLFEAATEEREQVIRELSAEMEKRVGEISELLEAQERQHEMDRTEWQERLNDAEDQMRVVRENNDSSKQAVAALEDLERRYNEDRVKWMESLRAAEKQIAETKTIQAQGGESNEVSKAIEEQQRRHELDRDEWQSRLSAMEAQLEAAHREKREIASRFETSKMQEQQRQDRALGIAEDKLAQTLAILDEREEQISQLKSMIKSMSDEVNDHREGVQEAEDEVDELRHQNEVLQHRLESKESECTELHQELSSLQSDSDQLVALKMELRMLKEDRQRERAQSQSVAENASSNTAKISSERDAALAEVSSLRQQLAAVQADVEIAQQDAARAQKANENLQMALESLQAERDAELNLLEEQRLSTEESAAAAHAAALEATHEANEARIREIEAEAEARIRQTQEEMRKLEDKLESFRVDNAQMRRSLDEAISRLQHNVEDVIDRTLMKNILLDWLTKHGNKEKRQILEMMSSLLHFTEEEKARVHIGGEDFSIGKVVATVAAPPPPSKADVEHLEGANVQEKWVNFLLAETDD